MLMTIVMIVVLSLFPELAVMCNMTDVCFFSMAGDIRPITGITPTVLFVRLDRQPEN